MVKGERRCAGRSKVRDAQLKPILDAEGKVQWKPCQAPPIRGGTVCIKHGGKAPHVRAAANRRLLAMVEPSLIRLEDLAHQDEHPPTALGAIRTILERVGNPIGVLKTAGEVKDTRPQITIGIAVGGINPPTMQVTEAPPIALPPAVDDEEIIDADE